MRHASSRRLVRPGTGAFLTLLVMVAVASPAPARAGCDHLVSWWSNPLDSTIAADLLDLLDPSQSRPPGGDLPDDRLPCSGPSCSSKPFVPSAPTATPSTTAEHWGCLCDSLASDRCGPSLLPPDHGDRHSLHHGPSVFHPPRPSV